MKTGKDVIALAKKYFGKKYVLGAFAPANDSDYAGPFDCAEYVKYINFQTFGVLFGTDTHDVKKASIADGYTGYFAKDVVSMGVEIPVEMAVQIEGAMLLRKPKPGAIGHIVFSQGNGKSAEAHSTKQGTGEFPLTGRRFDCGILLPNIKYNKPNTDIKSSAPKIVYRLKDPLMKDDYIGALQKALKIKSDNVFGPATNTAVVNYQREHGLIVDGEVMPGGQTAKSLGLK